MLKELDVIYILDEHGTNIDIVTTAWIEGLIIEYVTLETIEQIFIESMDLNGTT